MNDYRDNVRQRFLLREAILIYLLLIFLVLALTNSAHPQCAKTTHTVASEAFTISSSAFHDHGSIPVQFTCDGANISPPLNWQGIPSGTKSLALIVDDPDAPDPAAPKTTWIHWVLFNIPPDLEGLPEAVTSQNSPPEIKQGRNSWNKLGYGGPCPPIGRHRYFFKLYALDRFLLVPTGATKQDIIAAMAGHVLGKAVLVGTYQR